jgi:hypothetical protein
LTIEQNLTARLEQIHAVIGDLGDLVADVDQLDPRGQRQFLARLVDAQNRLVQLHHTVALLLPDHVPAKMQR